MAAAAIAPAAAAAAEHDDGGGGDSADEAASSSSSSSSLSSSSSSSSDYSHRCGCCERAAAMAPPMAPFRGDPGHNSENHVTDFEDVMFETGVSDRRRWPAAFVCSLRGEPLTWLRRHLEQQMQGGTDWDAVRAAFLERYPSPWHRVERLLAQLRQGGAEPAADYVVRASGVVVEVQALVPQLGGDLAVAVAVLQDAKKRFVDGLREGCYNPAMEMSGVDLQECFGLALRAEEVSMKRASAAAVAAAAAVVAAGAGAGEGGKLEGGPPAAEPFGASVRALWAEVADLEGAAEAHRDELERVKDAVAVQGLVVEREWPGHKEQVTGLREQVAALTEKVAALVEQQAGHKKQQASAEEQVQRQLAALRKEVKAQETRVQAQERQIKAQEDRLAGHVVKLAAQEEQLRAYVKKVEEQKEQLRAQEAHLAGCKKQLTAQQERVQEEMAGHLAKLELQDGQLREYVKKVVEEHREQQEEKLLAGCKKQIKAHQERVLGHLMKLDDNVMDKVKKVEEQVQAQERLLAGYRKQLTAQEEQLAIHKDQLAEHEEEWMWRVVELEQEVAGMIARPAAPLLPAAGRGSGQEPPPPASLVIERISAPSFSFPPKDLEEEEAEDAPAVAVPVPAPPPPGAEAPPPPPSPAAAAALPAGVKPKVVTLVRSKIAGLPLLHIEGEPWPDDDLNGTQQQQADGAAAAVVGQGGKKKKKKSKKKLQQQQQQQLLLQQQEDDDDACTGPVEFGGEIFATLDDLMAKQMDVKFLHKLTAMFPECKDELERSFLEATLEKHHHHHHHHNHHEHVKHHHPH